MENISDLISQMTLEEKASFCSGQDFWHLKGLERLGIPSLTVTDGPHGLRKQTGSSDQIGLFESVPATCFPTASALAASWNRDLVFEVAQAIGEECREEKVNVILGPGANIKRSPLCGRNFEYFSEDPYLTGEIAKSHIKGVQSQGVGTSLKHYAANNQEYRRMIIDSIIDERALREIYLAGYEIAVKDAQPWTVMCAYNKVNGTYCAENPKLMTEILKDEWGHQGLVITDWGAMNERVAAIKAGVELEMPGVDNGNDDLLISAVQNGQLEESILDQAVGRILTLINKAAKTLEEDFTYDRQAHHLLARRAAAEGAVLLKNESALLPLNKNAKTALIGRFARQPRYQGAGSSLVNPTFLDNLYDQLAALIGAQNLVYAPGYDQKGELVDENLLDEAITVAQSADVVLICAGLTEYHEVEGLDRKHIRLPHAHNALIHKISQVHDKVVVVLSNGSPVEMPWVDDVPAILEGYLGGQAGAGGIADILLGKVNPSGKLAETFPLKLEDNPSYHYFPMGPSIVEYRESIFVGYRYYDTVEQEVLFPFGHGLSYSSFEYRDLALSRSKLTAQDSLTVTLKVKNNGTLAGEEVIQVYVSAAASSIFRPHKELKGFVKVFLQPDQEDLVSIELEPRAFSYFDTNMNAWQVEPGMYSILVGASSQDIRLQTSLEITSTQIEMTRADQEGLSVYYDFPRGTAVSLEVFASLLGRSVPDNRLPLKGEYDINTPVGDMRATFIGRQLYSFLESQVRKRIKGREDTPTAYLMQSMLHEIPLRQMLMTDDSPFNRPMLEALLLIINGRFLKGLYSLIKSLII